MTWRAGPAAPFRIWTPRRPGAAPADCHLARAYEERVRARLATTPAARAAHAQLAELHRSASKGRGSVLPSSAHRQAMSGHALPHGKRSIALIACDRDSSTLRAALPER